MGRPSVEIQTAAYLKGEVNNFGSIQTFTAYIKKTVGLVFFFDSYNLMLDPVNLYSDFYQH